MEVLVAIHLFLASWPQFTRNGWVLSFIWRDRQNRVSDLNEPKSLFNYYVPTSIIPGIRWTWIWRALWPRTSWNLLLAVLRLERGRKQCWKRGLRLARIGGSSPSLGFESFHRLSDDGKSSPMYWTATFVDRFSCNEFTSLWCKGILYQHLYNRFRHFQVCVSILPTRPWFRQRILRMK